MAKVNLTEALAQEYLELYGNCEVRQERMSDVDRIVDAVLSNKPRYEEVSATIQAPWYFVAAIHNMEASGRFDRHLHNGDPLTARTLHVPAGRPLTGSPPFTWEVSAVDALEMRKINTLGDWSLSRLLYELEGYNGWGYRLFHPHVKTPYLWSFSNHYQSGKYIADGTWSDTAVSKQCGAAVILRRLQERGEIGPLTGKAPTEPVLRYSPSIVVQRADDLQRFLNTFPGISLRVDGKLGDRTSDAFKSIFGHHLDGDPRTKG